MNLLTSSDHQFLKELQISWLAEAKALLSRESNQTISLSEYHRALCAHDWYYDYSDCYRTRDDARKNMCRLEAIAAKHYEYKKHLELFKKWSGVNFNRPCSMPSKPNKKVLIFHGYVKKSES